MVLLQEKGETMNLAKTLKHARINANLSQKQLAEKMGYKTSQFVSSNERGVSQPAMATLKKLCKIPHFCWLMEVDKWEKVPLSKCF